MSTLLRPYRLLPVATLLLLLMAPLRPASAAGSAGRGASAALTPPVAALQATGMPSSGLHALGFVPNPAVAPPPPSAPSTASLAALPTAVDLSQYNPPVGDQKGVLSCVSWAVGYYLSGWYAKRDGHYPPGGLGGTGSFAPMYLYSQLVHGHNVGTSFSDNLSILHQQGIDTRADYTQGDYDFTDLPTPSETANAANDKLASYGDVRGPNLQQWIESNLATGNPVAVALPIYPEFDHASAAHPLVGVPLPGEDSRGGHAVFASKYDANGLWIENSWGTGYGLNGYAELSWDFVNQYVTEAVDTGPLSASGAVPNVIGLAPTPAASAVRAAGFGVVLAPTPDRTCNNIGLVMGESPNPGTWTVLGATVTLIVGARPPTPCP